MKCKCCGKEFTKKWNSQKYCSDECRSKVKKLQDKHNSRIAYIRSKENQKEITCTCEYCGKEFTKTHGNQKYCSKICADNKILEQNADARMKSYHKNKKRGGDKIWGLGTGGLGPHKHEDWETEKLKVENEKCRLGLGK